MNKQERLIYVQKHWNGKNTKELAEKLGVHVRSIRRYLVQLDLRKSGETSSPPKNVERTVDDIVSESRIKKNLRIQQKEGRELAARVADLEERIEAATLVMEYRDSYTIPHAEVRSSSAAVAVAVASDWHIEEEVHSWQTNGTNKFNEEICHARVRRFFQHTANLVKLHQQHTQIQTLILALLGDFITNDLHEENAETARLLPMEAMIECKAHLSSGIRFLLKHTDVNLIIPTASGNHGRTTRRVHMSTEHGHSLEYFMYCSLADEFKEEPRVTFMLNKGYHTYVQVWPTFVIRFHHGHSIRYYGGVGGLSIPMNKAVAQWDKHKRADLDVIGHFHQFLDGGNWMVNGSLIGFNAFALRIKASPEPPTQAFFLIDRSVGKTVVCPIILTEDR